MYIFIYNIGCLALNLQFVDEVLPTNYSNSVLSPILPSRAKFIRFSTRVSEDSR